MEPEGSLPCLQ